MAFNIVLGIGEHLSKLRDEEIDHTLSVYISLQTIFTQAFCYSGKLGISLAAIQNGVKDLCMLTNNIILV